MALTECKECKKEIYSYAEKCPHCGVDKPGISYVEERLLSDLEQAKIDEDYYRKLALDHSGGIWNLLFCRGTRDECTSRADGRRQEARRIEGKISEIRSVRNA